MSSAMPSAGASGRPAPRIFVSHSHKDATFCLKLIADLRARLGEDAVWYDESGGEHGLAGGDAWWDKIIAEITARPYFLVVLSPNSAPPNSVWVPQEMGIAFRQHVELGKRLLPVWLADAPRRADWSGIHEFNFAAPRPYDQALDELLAALHVAARPPLTAPAPVAAPSPQEAQQMALVERLAQEAHTAYGRERWSVTLDKTNALVTRQGMTPALWRERASAALALGEAPVALDAVERALRQNGDDIETLRLKGRILLREGKAAEAVQALEEAVTLAPLDDATTGLPLLADLGDALEQQGNWAGLLRRCGDALDLTPQSVVWQRRRRDALTKLGRNSDALAAAQTLAALPDATAADSLTLARLLKQAGASREAISISLNTASVHARDKDTEAQVAQARRELLAPPPPPIPPERFPARLTALGFQAQARDGVEWIVPPVCRVPAGQFKLGSDKRRDSLARDDELNRRVVTLGDYAIGRFPVTAAEYACFVNATQRAKPASQYNNLTWEQQLRERLDHPVVNVAWRDAYDYAEWLAGRSGQPWRLPTEAEWEKAARCDPRDPLGASSERIYPWGNSFESVRCNTSESGIGATTPVGSYPANDSLRSGSSPCGAEDMAGNVWEWTASERAQDYSKSESQSVKESTSNRILRGGSWGGTARDARVAYRLDGLPDTMYSGIGFRVLLAGGSLAQSI